MINRTGIALCEVCNRNANEFEVSEPEKYTEWILERNGWTGGNGLKKVSRLLKYLRDFKSTFACQSFLLTILLGERISADDKENMTDFKDVPTALKTIVGRLDDWLQFNEVKPIVANPVLPGEFVSCSWSDTNYKTFRARVNTYRRWIDDAYAEKNVDESIAKWRLVFGDSFARGVVIEKAASVSDQALIEARANGIIPYSQTTNLDLVSLFHRCGKIALPRGFDSLPHKRRPHWEMPEPLLFEVRVGATLHRERFGPVIESVIDDGRPLPRHRWLQFRVYSPRGLPLNGYRVYWQIANTGREAFLANCLRGDFYGPTSGVYWWERLLYRGVHCAQAFVVCKREDVLVTRSLPFHVSIA